MNAILTGKQSFWHGSGRYLRSSASVGNADRTGNLSAKSHGLPFQTRGMSIINTRTWPAMSPESVYGPSRENFHLSIMIIPARIY